MSNKGQEEAHTPAAPAASASSPAGIDAEDALPGADPLDLLDGSPDLGDRDLLATAAELVAAPRRARGRPPGALNRKNGDMVAYLQSLGHRDPWVTLSMIQTADTEKLAQKLSMKRGEVLALQLRAADALMPYHHAKKPQQLDLPVGDKRPLMVIGEMNVAIGNGLGFMSAGIVPDADMQGNQGVSGGDAVRDSKVISHDPPK